jgi:hypothetical protein
VSRSRPSALACLLAAGCVGTNPRWDGPAGESVARDSDVSSEDSAGTTTTGIGTSAELTTGFASGDTSTTGVGPGDGSTTDGPPLHCPMLGEVSCDGACRKIDSDKHYCGLLCTDCTEIYGDDARCEHGLCRDKEMDDGKSSGEN